MAIILEDKLILKVDKYKNISFNEELGIILMSIILERIDINKNIAEPPLIIKKKHTAAADNEILDKRSKKLLNFIVSPHLVCFIYFFIIQYSVLIL